MNFSLLTSLFKPKNKILHSIESQLIKKIKEITDDYNLYLFESRSIYHRDQKRLVPLTILHPKDGLLLFEYKDWSYDDLKNATVSEANNKSSDQNNLAFESLQEFLLLKYKELTHTDKLEFSNYLLMENISSQEYELLDNSFQKLLPKHRVIFNDSSHEEIVEKLSFDKLTQEIYTPKAIFPNLFIQYAIFNSSNRLSLATKEQREFIDATLQKEQRLVAPTGSGKTEAIILKALLLKLDNPQKEITIIEPTKIASDIIRKKLLALIEHAIVSINPLSIEITTPIEIVNKQLSKSNKPQIYSDQLINNSLDSKAAKIADYLICDDIELLTQEFINYISSAQKKDNLLLVSNNLESNSDFIFTNNFTTTNREIIFKQANQHAKALQLTRELCASYDPRDILIVCSLKTKENLKEDLDSFIKDKVILLDSSKTLLAQEFDSLMLASYSETSGLSAKFVLMLDIDEATQNEIEYVKNIASQRLYILYEDDSLEIEKLKGLHASEINRSRV